MTTNRSIGRHYDTCWCQYMLIIHTRLFYVFRRLLNYIDLLITFLHFGEIYTLIFVMSLELDTNFQTSMAWNQRPLHCGRDDINGRDRIPALDCHFANTPSRNPLNVSLSCTSLIISRSPRHDNVLCWTCYFQIDSVKARSNQSQGNGKSWSIPCTVNGTLSSLVTWKCPKYVVARGLISFIVLLRMFPAANTIDSMLQNAYNG
jgi:hypothetical protein